MCPPELEPPWKEIDMSFLLVGEHDLEEGRQFCVRWMCRGHEAIVCRPRSSVRFSAIALVPSFGL